MTLVKLQMTGAALAALLTLVAPPAAATTKQQNVTVVNPPTKPVNARVTNTVLTVDADNPDRHPFSAELCQHGEGTTCDLPGSIAAPPDRDIVIDTFSGECSIANEGSFRSLNAYIDPGTGLFERNHYFPPQYATPPGASHTIHQFHFQTRLHVPANGKLAFNATSPAPNGSYLAYCRYYVSGYTVIP
jgi:hypothetical protein